MATANLVDSGTAARRANGMLQFYVAFVVAVPILGLFAIIGLYTFQLGRAFAHTKRLYLTLPTIIVTGLVHFFVPIWALGWGVPFDGPFWNMSAASFVLYFVSLWVNTKVEAI